MKLFAVLCVVVAAAAVASAGYGDILDGTDFEVVLNDEKLYKSIYNCLVDQGPCDGDLQQMKEILPKLIESKCGDCTPAQKEKYDNLEKLYIEKYPKEHEELLRRFSPKKEETQA